MVLISLCSRSFTKSKLFYRCFSGDRRWRWQSYGDSILQPRIRNWVNMYYQKQISLVHKNTLAQRSTIIRLQSSTNRQVHLWRFKNDFKQIFWQQNHLNPYFIEVHRGIFSMKKVRIASSKEQTFTEFLNGF